MMNKRFFTLVLLLLPFFTVNLVQGQDNGCPVDLAEADRLLTDAHDALSKNDVETALALTRQAVALMEKCRLSGSDEIDTRLTMARQGVSNNAEWEPYVQDFDGVAMALVPAGCFMMGSADDQIDYAIRLAGERGFQQDRELYADEQPAHEQCFEFPFWIDQYEVTNSQFEAWGGQAVLPAFSSGPNQPRDAVFWSEARAFCELRGARLPTEGEWEYAARGPDSLVYPWGNEFIEENAVSMMSASPSLEVGSRPGGASWVGAFDMSGNLFEWVNTLEAPYPYDAADGRESGEDVTGAHILRGGSYLSWDFGLRASDRMGVALEEPNATHGFRCARPAS